jgi:hypothetical protein
MNNQTKSSPKPNFTSMWSLFVKAWPLVLVTVVLASSLTAMGVLAAIGTTDSSNPPSSTSSYSLEDVYNRLSTGSVGSQSTFTEPSVAPGTGTMHTINDIMGQLPALDVNGAGPTEVLSGKTFWGLTSGRWGPQTGQRYGGCTCSGSLEGTRWCDNGDGTVTDLLGGNNGAGRCLVWVKDASWGGTKPWRNISTDCSSPNYTCFDDAATRASSYGEQWRLPTKAELWAVRFEGIETVTSGTPRAFTNMQSSFWTSSSVAGNPNYVWVVSGGVPTSILKNISGYDIQLYVWPVRNGQ